MTSLERAVVDLVRLGLAADAASVRRYAMKLLQTTADEVGGAESDFKAAIARLVVDQSAARKVARSAPRDVPAAAPPDTLALTHVERIQHPVAPVLAESVVNVLRLIVSEREPAQARALAALGIDPTRTLLLTGVPGVGKTMTARYLAGALDLPLLTVDLAALMSSYLGKTGQNLRRALDHARHHPSVLLLDEFDALGKRRDDPSDVGELKRIVNVLLSELERWPSHSLFVAATNHPELLDRAIWRRFDRVLVLELPIAAARREIIVRVLGEHGFELTERDLALTVDATEGLSGSDLTRFVRSHIRTAVVDGVSADALPLAHTAMGELMRRAWNGDQGSRARFAGLADRHWHWSQREIAEMLRVSHVTVGKMLKVWEAEQAAQQTESMPPLRPAPVEPERPKKASRTTKTRTPRT
ncbi:MAG TPA: ATP-binding protein [Longimicrobiaceae bacterium]